MSALSTTLDAPGAELPPALAPLAPGSRVALLAPSGPVSEDRVGRAVSLLRGWGLQPALSASATACHPRAGYLSGPDAQRAADLQQAWCDPEIEAICCLRGGYGSVRLLDLLDVDAMRAARPKPFHGSSDVTALHEWFGEQLGVPTWFSPMVGSPALLDDVAARAGLQRALLSPRDPMRWTSPQARVLVPGTASGRLVGGNLALLAMTVGARGRPPLARTGCLVLLEDVTEDTYRIDGYLQALLRAGWFDGVTGIALGSWVGCAPPAEIAALAVELLGPLGVPLVHELGFGHCPGAHTIPLGVPGTLRAEAPGAGPQPWGQHPLLEVDLGGLR